MNYSRLFLVLARAIDYRIGKRDEDVPDLPILSRADALISFYLKLFILLMNFITCVFVIANIICHW